MQRSVHTATIVLERLYPASSSRVFAAWASPEARLRWGPPSDTAGLVYVEADFRPGGRDLARCGALGDLRYDVETRYLDIVPDTRIVMTEAVSTDGALLSVALITIEFTAEAGATRLRLTDQIVALDGAEMIEGSRIGWSASLDNLAREFPAPPSRASAAQSHQGRSS